MKNSALVVSCYIALLAVPCASLGTAGSTQADQLHAVDSRVAPALRGNPRQQNVMVALQISKNNQAVKAATKRSHSWLQRRAKMRHHAMHEHKQVAKVGTCRKNKLRWWIKIKKKCSKAFGKESRWDREKLDGQCGEAWNDCNTGFYAVCCTQPLGPRNMEAYCAGKNLTFLPHNASVPEPKDKDDKACQVQNKMKDVQDVMKGIKDTVSLMGIADQPVVSYAYGPGPAPAPMPAVPMPPPGLMEPPAPAPAPMPFVALPTPLQSKCAMLTELTRQAAERIKAIETWAQEDGIEQRHKQTARKGSGFIQKKTEAEPESQEATDPDLVFTVEGVVSVGNKLDELLKGNNFCGKQPEEDDDDDEDDVEADLAKDPTQEEEEDDEEEEPVLAVNETSILELLAWEGDMKNAVDKFEVDVHPHGYKWWRYRYEYTEVESVVLAFSVLCMYCTMWLLHGVSFFQVHKFYKTGIAQRVHRYAWGYLVFHAASLMVMVTLAYTLYIPWGKTNIFDWFATAFHTFVDGRANVPIVGYSWMYMVLDVQFQLFVCFALYALFVLMVASDYKRALEDWKTLSEGGPESSCRPANVHEYRCLDAIMKKRVQNTPEYRQLFHELKLRLPGVEGLDKALPGWNDFKLHLYLTDGLGKSVEYLVQVSLTTNLFLAGSALVVAILAHHFQVAFMYFLPGFLAIGAIMFIASYFVGRHFRALADDDDHNTTYTYVSVHTYCRAIQIMLYCLFFSFSRLLLSNDIFEFYPKVYCSALVSLAIVLLLLTYVAGQTMKETTCALILPPHISQEQLKVKLEQVLYWHTTEKCHECGVQQFPAHASLSKEWAGKTPSGERKDAPLDSARPFSFRG